MAEQQRERDIAEMEAQMAHDTDQYFEARPQIMRTRDKEATLEAGFKAAWAARPLSHAEGEAVPVDIDAEYEAFCRWCRESGFNLDYRLHTHSGRRVSDGAYIRDENARRMFRAWRERAAHPAPQVAVPEQREWNQAAGRDDLKYTEGWNDCRDAMLAAAPTAPAREPETVTLDQHDREMTQVIEERDEYHDIADKLADAIAEHMGVEIGEHSSANCPWENALEAMANADPDQQPVSDPDGLRSAAAALLERLPTDDIGLAVFHAGDEVRALMDALTAPAPDEREIAALREALEKIAPYPKSPEWELDYPTCRRIAREALEQGSRLRAGKEGEPS